MKTFITLGFLICFFNYCHSAPVVEEDHELIGGFFEGDMEIEFNRNGVIAESKRWPNKVVHYKIDEVFGGCF